MEVRLGYERLTSGDSFGDFQVVSVHNTTINFLARSFRWETGTRHGKLKGCVGSEY